MALEVTVPEDPDEWRRMVAILSLDRVKPFYAAMGLDFVDGSRFQGVLQRWLHSLLLASSSGVARPTCSDLLSAIGASEGAETPEKFARWAHFVHFSTNESVLQTWQILLTSTCRNAAKWAALGLPENASTRIRQACLKATSIEDVEARVAVTEDEPLSDWDLGIYALMAFDDDVNDPLNSVVLTCGRRRFMDFWRELMSSLNREELGEFLARGRAAAVAMKSRVELTLPNVREWS